MMFLIAQQDLPTNLQGPAWAIGGTIIIWAAGSLVLKFYELRWGKGSEAILKERESTVKQKELELREKELDVHEISSAYEAKIKEVETRNEKRIAELQAHVDVMDKKLDASEKRERECVRNMALLEGRLQVLEAIYSVDKKVDLALTNQKKLAEESGINLSGPPSSGPPASS